MTSENSFSRYSRCQFHQHFMSNCFVQNCFSKLFYNYSLALWFFGERILAQKLLVKCWWNWLEVSFSPTLLRGHSNNMWHCFGTLLTPRSQFHQHFTHSFYSIGPIRTKRHWWPQCLFALLGSASVKTSSKMLIKLTSGWCFNISNYIILRLVGFELWDEIVRNCLLKPALKQNFFIP